MLNETRKLFSHLWRGGQWAFLWTMPGRKSHWFKVSEMPTQLKPIAYNLYFGVHPVTEIPSTNSQGKAADPQYVRSQIPYIAAVNCLFAEFDAKDYTDKAAALGTVRLLTPPPSVIVDSGGGYHCYWLLDATLPIYDDDTRDYVRRLQWRWVQHVGGDNGAKDLCRVLRVPGSVNYKEKYAPDFPTVKVERWLDVTYSIHELTARLPPERRRERRRTRTDDLADALDRAVARVQRAHNGIRNTELYKASFILRDAINNGIVGRDEAADNLLSAATAIGLPEREALATINSGLGGTQ